MKNLNITLDSNFQILSDTRHREWKLSEDSTTIEFLEYHNWTKGDDYQLVRRIENELKILAKSSKVFVEVGDILFLRVPVADLSDRFSQIFDTVNVSIEITKVIPEIGNGTLKWVEVGFKQSRGLEIV